MAKPPKMIKRCIIDNIEFTTRYERFKTCSPECSRTYTKISRLKYDQKYRQVHGPRKSHDPERKRAYNHKYYAKNRERLIKYVTDHTDKAHKKQYDRERWLQKKEMLL